MPAPVHPYQRRRRAARLESGTTTANLTPYAMPLGTVLRSSPFPGGGSIDSASILTARDFGRRSRLRRRRRARWG